MGHTEWTYAYNVILFLIIVTDFLIPYSIIISDHYVNLTHKQPKTRTAKHMYITESRSSTKHESNKEFSQ